MKKNGNGKGKGTKRTTKRKKTKKTKKIGVTGNRPLKKKKEHIIPIHHERRT